MKKQNDIFSRVLMSMVFGFLYLSGTSVWGQTIMFDDFTYTGVSDPQLSVFNKWSIINGTSGPPEGAQYSRNNITFINDPVNSSNKLMTLSTTVNGQTKATTHSRIETNGFDYFHGTYAARVYFSENPFTYKDANIQTFYTIVSSSLAGDGSRYSELDFEYMAADKWGVAADKQVMYMTSWNRYVAEPWQAWKRYFASQKSWEGWHTCVVSCTDRVNVKYWIDGVYFGSQATTDNDGTSVYPRNPMQIAFANWIWNNVTGSSTANRTTTMQVDWTLFYKDTEVSPAQVDNLVASYRSQGVQRRNIAGQVYSTGAVNQSPSVSISSPANNATYTAPASITINANASDADGSISKVEFYNGNTLLSTDNTSPYSYSWTNVAAGSYSIRAVSYDNLNATSTATVTVVVNPAPIPQSPYGGSAWAIPGIIEAENYDLGGQNVAYNETTTANEGGAYRTDPVDIESISGGGYNVAYIVNGEWLEYTTSISAGIYTIDATVASTQSGKTFRLELDGAVLGTFTVPQTGGWQTWQTVRLNNITLAGGQNKILRVVATSTDFNLDKITFAKVVTNQLPSVSITSPTNGATFVSPALIVINANASDADGSISKVEFYNGTSLLGSDASAPYSYSWSGVNAGTYSITAKATDNNGGVATSTIVNVVVNNPAVVQTPYGGTAWSIPGTIETENYDLGGQGISFNELSPANEGGAYRTDAVDIEPTSGGGFNVGYIIQDEWLEYTVNVTGGTYKLEAKVAATATGKTFRVELDGVSIATVNVPNTGGWQNWQTVTINNISVTSGQKVLRVYATSTDFNLDKIVFTNNTTVNQNPSVSLTAPMNNSTYQSPATIVISANASDVDGSINSVEFYSGSILLGSDNSSPFTFTWSGLAVGSYTIYAKAIDNSGAVTNSSSVVVSVITVSSNVCSNVPTYVQNGGYAAGSKVQLNGKLYECKPYPYSGWCNAGEWAYAPGSGYYWQDAWIDLGSCTGSSMKKASSVSSFNEAGSKLSASPNPFYNTATIEVNVEAAGDISVKVYDKTGLLITTLFEGYQYEGKYTYEFNSSRMASGIYYVKFESAQGVNTTKIMKAE